MLKNTNKKLSLKKAIDISYLPEKQAKKALKKYGFLLDDTLSKEFNHLIAYNREKNKIIDLIPGTNKKSDILTDLTIASGNLKNTDRYKDEKNLLLKTKNKYKNSSVSVVGHSLSGAIINELMKDAEIKKEIDKAYVYNPAILNSRLESGIIGVRNEYDPFSIGSTNIKTIENRTVQNPNEGLLNKLLKTHSTEGLKENKQYITV